ncbi:hypothetical protein [Xenorhabdus bovienii]|uniref:hypothetical protein n=1 Tax=Xenorhabdus bovienii TaxID=40576 RepID=UPI0023B23739|nr:hypothetical protein [Xenorhabdus bovienii]MDE9553671.1 hypothetical protein [Xenorhabdus bovienii]
MELNIEQLLKTEMGNRHQVKITTLNYIADKNFDEYSGVVLMFTGENNRTYNMYLDYNNPRSMAFYNTFLSFFYSTEHDRDKIPATFEILYHDDALSGMILDPDEITIYLSWK